MATKPSLALIPSAYKASKVYSILPNNGDGDFTFSRGSEATRINKDGLIETVSSNIPRLDYSGGGCPSLLLEPQRTNAFTYSEQFNQSVWFKSDCTITTNQIISPDGTLTADLATSTANNGGVFRFSSWSTTEKTVSIFVKKNTSSTVEIFNATASANRVLFNLDNGTITTQGGTMTGTIEDFGNGWYRLTATHTAVQLETLGIKPKINESIYIWGGQIEDASYSSSYIKTEASTVTRLADNCYGAGNSNLFDITEGTMYFELSKNVIEPINYSGLSLSDSSLSNRIEFRYEPNSNILQAVVRVSGAAVVVLSYTIADVTQKHKVAITFKEDDYAFWVNGLKVGIDTSGTVPTGLRELAFDDGSGANDFYGNVHDARVYDEVLTDAELTELTTL